MNELINQLKSEIIEVLNLEDVKPEDIDNNAPCLAMALASIRLTLWSLLC